MKKITTISPANIAFIKFWGKRDLKLNLPLNDSFSMNLSECLTTCSVLFDGKFNQDRVLINGLEAAGSGKTRVVKILDEVRKMSGIQLRAEVLSTNNFPTGAGIASSASAFSALALAASEAAGLILTKKNLSILARLGSGSACRSIVEGFAYWKAGNDSETSFAVQLASKDFWKISDVIAVVETGAKKISSGEGHEAASTSPYFFKRLKLVPKRIVEMKKEFLKKNFSEFGKLVEEEAIDLHVMAMTSKPPILYWNEGTTQVIQNVMKWREEGLESFFTMDAGANVHVICRQNDAKKLNLRLKKLSCVLGTIINFPCDGTRVVREK